MSLEKTISRATKAGLRDIKPISQDGMYGSSIVEWMKINIELISHDGMQWSSIVEWMKRNGSHAEDDSVRISYLQGGYSECFLEIATTERDSYCLQQYNHKAFVIPQI